MFHEIDILNNISEIPSNFNKPYIIKNGCKTMGAISKWNFDYIKNNMNNVLFPVEIYNNKKDMSTSNVSKIIELEFDIIVNNIKKKKSPYYYCAEIDLLNFKEKINEQIFDDIDFEYDTIRESQNNLIFMGHNTQSGCHLHTGDDFMLNQIFGTKIVYLFDYNDNPDLKFNSFFSRRCNFTKENFFDLDLKKYKIYQVILNPGDSLLIPPWWFHAVLGIGDCCSITKTYYRTDYYYFIKHPYIFLLFLSGLIREYFICFENFFIFYNKQLIIVLSLLMLYCLNYLCS